MKSNANSLNEINSLNQMCVFIKFWILKTENKFLHVFSFLHKLSFKNSFCFLFILGCQTNFLVSKIETESKEKKNNYQTYSNVLTIFSIYHKNDIKKFSKISLITIALRALLHITHILFGICLLSWMLSRIATKIFPIYY